MPHRAMARAALILAAVLASTLLLAAPDRRRPAAPTTTGSAAAAPEAQPAGSSAIQGHDYPNNPFPKVMPGPPMPRGMRPR